MRGSQAAKIYSDNQRAALDEVRALDAWMDELRAQGSAIEAERTGVGRELAAVYLPDLAPETLERAARYTGFRGFAQRDPNQAKARELARLTGTIARLEADPEYAQRESLVGPAGRFTAKLAEARDFLESWQAECARFEALEGFLDLVTLGYDTPSFVERWWEPAYWRHWAQGDRICEALGLADFGDEVLPAWTRVSAPRDQWRTEVGRWEAEIHRIHGIVQEHDQAVERRGRLDTIYLDEARALLGRHLADADTALLASWAEGSPGNVDALPIDARRAVTLLLKRLSGLAAKETALREILARWASPTREQLAGAAAKFAVKAAKYSSGKKAAQTVLSVPTDYPEKVARIAQRRVKAQASGRKVVAFREYDRFHLHNDDALWWLLFTGGHPPGAWYPSMYDWYTRHPDARVVDDPEWTDARGRHATAGVHHLDTSGDVS